ncbi:hypothetical protein ACEUZ9_002957 [Paracoccus litorisediminis]|uniref:hypothetical protein n=1 Tax=Paracoccus litorisediminis TaxID=2006130 RepID=UPI0037318DFF
MTLLLFLALIVGIITGLSLIAPVHRIVRDIGAVLTVFLLLPAMSASAGTFDTIIGVIAPSSVELIGAVLTACIGWLVLMLRQRFGIEIEARHREALHWALYSAAQLAIAQKLTGPAAINLIKGYVIRSVPDAMARLNPSSQVLSDLAKAKLEQVAAEKGVDRSDAAVDKLAEALKRAVAV